MGGALQSFCRKLVWHRECLWPQDLPQHCLLVLEAEDDLVPSKLARTMLHKMKHPCDVRSPLLFHACAISILMSAGCPDMCCGESFPHCLPLREVMMLCSSAVATAPPW